MTLANYTVLSEQWSQTDKTISKWANSLKQYIDRKACYSFNSISAFGETVKLSKTLDAVLSKKDGYYLLENDYLDMHCIGETEEEVKKEFFELFIADKENYFDCKKNELSKSGLAQRERIASYL